MRCLIVVPSLMRAGAETQAVDLANGLSSMGHSVHLAALEPQLDQRERVAPSVRFHHVPRKRKYDLSVVRALADIIDRNSIEVIHAVIQFSTLLARMAVARSRTKPVLVAAIHTTVNQTLKAELQDRLVYRPVLRRLPAVVFVCRHQRDHWVRKYPELERIARVIHNGVDPAMFRRADQTEAARRLREDFSIPAGAFVFSCLAAFRPEKAHELLIEAFTRLPADAFLLLAGEGARRAAIERRVHAASIEDRVRFLGTLPDVRPVIVASNATVLASTAVETFSMAMLESMALEVPMIAPRIGGLSEAIISGETGLLFPVGDAPALAASMKMIIEQPDASQRMGLAAAKKVREEFSLAQMLQRSEQVLADALRRRPATPAKHIASK